MQHHPARGIAAVFAFALATAPAQTLIAVDSSRQLSRLDPATAAKTDFGSVSANTVITASLTYDTLRHLVYVSSTANDRLYTLDVNTGTASLIGPYGDGSIVMHGIEYDSSTDTLYGASGGGTNNHLYVIDKTTGLATQLGNPGLTGYTNLCYDPFADVLYATNADTDSLYTVDRHNGHVTLVGPLNGPDNPNGLALHPVTGVMYLVDNTARTLHTVDKATGATTLVGNYGSGNLLGLTFVPATGTFATFGAGCAGALGVPTQQLAQGPAVGTTFAVDVDHMPLDAGIFVVGFSNTVSTLGPLPLDLGFVGAQGCALRVSLDILTPIAGTAGSNTARFQQPIPDLPATFVGMRFYTQAAVFDPTNAFGAVASDARSGVVGL